VDYTGTQKLVFGRSDDDVSSGDYVCRVYIQKNVTCQSEVWSVG